MLWGELRLFWYLSAWWRWRLEISLGTVEHNKSHSRKLSRAQRIIFRVTFGKMELPKTTSTHVRNSEKKESICAVRREKIWGFEGGFWLSPEIIEDFDCHGGGGVVISWHLHRSVLRPFRECFRLYLSPMHQAPLLDPPRVTDQV